jgi:hypothetical protein
LIRSSAKGGGELVTVINKHASFVFIEGFPDGLRGGGKVSH